MFRPQQSSSCSAIFVFRVIIVHIHELSTRSHFGSSKCLCLLGLGVGGWVTRTIIGEGVKLAPWGGLLRNMSFLEDCWRVTAARPTKRARSLCDIALGIGDGNIMPMPFAEPAALPHWDIVVPPEPQQESPLQVTPAAVAEDPSGPRLKCKSSRPRPSAEEALNHAAVLRMWIQIVTDMGQAFRMNAHEVEWTEELIEPYFDTRRTGTLSVHASAWRLFLKYAADAGLDASDISEPMVYEYLKHLRDSAAPATRAKSFLKACNFAFGLCSFERGNSIALSARCMGLAAKALKGKRRRKQRDPLKGKWLHVMEQAVVAAYEGHGLLSKHEGVVTGFLVFTAHARARCSDAARIVVEPLLDEPEDGDPESSFIEAVTQGSQVKTGNTSEKADLALPVVALSRGISDSSWGAAWLGLRAELFLDATEDETLMLEPLADGTFGEGRIQAGQATAWLQHILLKLGVPAAELTNIGSHSCKATVLSIAAKAGLSRDTRRTLGGHATPGDNSVDVYSRDALAAPLLEVGLLFMKIRAKLFDPDSSRSGRWRRAAAPLLPSQSGCCAVCRFRLNPNDPVFQCACGNWVHIDGNCGVRCVICSMDICKSCAASSPHVCPTADDLSDAEDDDQSSSSDGEQADMVAREAEGCLDAEVRELTKNADGGADAAFPVGGIFVHKITETAHKLKDAHCTACGIPADPIRFDYFYEGDSVPRANLCWRSGCTPWICAPSKEHNAVAAGSRPRASRKLK